MDYLETIGKSLQSGNSKQIRLDVEAAIRADISYQDILKRLLDIMEEVGEKFKVNELFVPEVLIIGRAFNVALKMISPLLEGPTEDMTIVIGTVRGDMHNVGKNLVKILMVSTGATVIDLGVDVEPKVFVEAIKEHKPDILAMSSLLTTTMVQMNQTIKAIEKEGLRDQIKILIGGAPVTANYATNIGADYFAKDAAVAAEYVRNIIKEKKNHKP